MGSLSCDGNQNRQSHSIVASEEGLSSDKYKYVLYVLNYWGRRVKCGEAFVNRTLSMQPSSAGSLTRKVAPLMASFETSSG